MRRFPTIVHPSFVCQHTRMHSFSLLRCGPLCNFLGRLYCSCHNTGKLPVNSRHSRSPTSDDMDSWAGAGVLLQVAVEQVSKWDIATITHTSTNTRQGLSGATKTAKQRAVPISTVTDMAASSLWRPHRGHAVVSCSICSDSTGLRGGEPRMVLRSRRRVRAR